MAGLSLRERGFSLVESIFAIGLLTTALITLAYLVSVGVATDGFARHATLAAICAAQKMEELRGARTLAPESEVVEFLDADGTVVCGSSICGTAVYVRRSSIETFSGVLDTVLIRVSVRHRVGASRAAGMVAARARVRE